MGHHKELIVQTPRAPVGCAHDGGHFTLPLRRRRPTFSNWCTSKGAPLRTPRSILADTQEQRTHSRALSTPNALRSANDTRERLTTDHTRRHTKRALLSPTPRVSRAKTTPPRRMKGFVGAVWKVLAHNAPKRSEKFALSRGDRPALRASIRRTGAR